MKLDTAPTTGEFQAQCARNHSWKNNTVEVVVRGARYNNDFQLALDEPGSAEYMMSIGAYTYADPRPDKSVVRSWRCSRAFRG